MTGDPYAAWGGGYYGFIAHARALNRARQTANELLDLCEAHPEKAHPIIAAMPDDVFAYVLAGLRYPDDDHRLEAALNQASLLGSRR